MKQRKNVRFPFTEVPKPKQNKVFQDNALIGLTAREGNNSSEVIATGRPDVSTRVPSSAQDSRATDQLRCSLLKGTTWAGTTEAGIDR